MKNGRKTKKTKEVSGLKYVDEENIRTPMKTQNFGTTSRKCSVAGEC
jgi:hypothetical protein